MEKFNKRCPYCGKIMSEGIIDGARYSLWWRDTDSKRGFLKSLLNLDKKNVRLSYPFYSTGKSLCIMNFILNIYCKAS